MHVLTVKFIASTGVLSDAVPEKSLASILILSHLFSIACSAFLYFTLIVKTFTLPQ
jgi:hypothetical protein